MLFIHRNNMIKQLPAQNADSPFADSVLPGGMKSCFHRLNLRVYQKRQTLPIPMVSKLPFIPRLPWRGTLRTGRLHREGGLSQDFTRPAATVSSLLVAKGFGFGSSAIPRIKNPEVALPPQGGAMDGVN